MHVKTIAGLFVLVSAAACGPGRQPAVTAPAPAPVAPEPPPLPVETVTPIEQAAPTGTSAATGIGADLLGSATYDLPVVSNLSVRNELEFLVYQRHAVVGSWLRNAERYHEFVRDVFASHGVPRDLSYLGMIESGYRPTVRSHAGAVGMWQFMPATGRSMGLRIDADVDERMDPVRATHAAARHLRYLHRRFNGDWSLAAAAYNAGEGRINRGMGRYGARDFWDLANRGDLAQETRRYVPRLYATTIIAKDPVRFGYPAPGLVRRFAYDSVRVDLATPLSVLAQVGNLPANELTEMNPHLFRQVAPRDYWVWVPHGQGATLQRAYAASEFRQRGGFGTYRVREGDSLTGLAQLSGLTPEQIRSMNLSANTDALRAGTTLHLYADAARVLNARSQPRLARSEPASSRPRVLGDPAPAADAPAPSASTSERRESSSSSASTAAAERRSGSSASESSGSAERRTGLVTAAERRAASERRSTSSGSSERRSASAESPERRSSSTESGSSRASGERASSSTSSASTTERRSGSGTAERTATTERRGGSAEGSAARRPSSTGSGSSRASGERASGSSSSASSERRSGGTSSSSAARTHTVADGETLWSIARRYEVTVDAVREANEIAESETIRPGQTLRIPRAASGSSATAASGTRTESGSSRTGTTASRPAEGSPSAARPSPSSSTSGSRPGSAARAREHTVGEGETLWGIARRYETTVDSLRRANDLEEDQQIQPGQKLSIPQN